MPDVIKPVIVWALFDSGNGCYKQAVDTYFCHEMTVYSIGLDVENKSDHFIKLNLADYSVLFGTSHLFGELDKLPYLDIILASPPCESWSNANAMRDGNVCWYTERIDTLFGEFPAANDFTVRAKVQLDKRNQIAGAYRTRWWKSVYNRVNGELCAFNIICIIERYKPRIWVIENPQSSRLWRYYEQIQDFWGIKNLAHYSAYDKAFPKKPTVFYSNIAIPLQTTAEKPEVLISRRKSKEDERKIIYGYNERSNIPLLLIRDILSRCKEQLQ